MRKLLLILAAVALSVPSVADAGWFRRAPRCTTCGPQTAVQKQLPVQKDLAVAQKNVAQKGPSVAQKAPVRRHRLLFWRR